MSQEQLWFIAYDSPSNKRLALNPAHDGALT